MNRVVPETTEEQHTCGIAETWRKVFRDVQSNGSDRTLLSAPEYNILLYPRLLLLRTLP